MASISFDKGTGWWSIRFFAGPRQGRIKKTLCRHPGEWSKSRPPRRPPPLAVELAAKYVDQERRAKLGIEVVVRETPLRSYVDAYRERVSHSLRPRTMSAIGVACEKFLRYCDGQNIKTLQAVTHLVCREWIVSRLSEGAERSTVVTERSNLMPIWAQAKRDRILIENPWADEPVPGKPRKEIPTAWTDEEVGKLLEKVDDWLKDLLMLGFNTGIRIGALLALRWGQIDWEAHLIRVRAVDSKSGKPYEVPMTPTAHDVLGRMDIKQKGHGPRDPIFLNPETGRPYVSRTTYTRIGRLVDLAGITNYGDFNHIMRRTFATLSLNSGVPMEIVQRCLGHSTMGQTEKAYAHLMTKRLKEGMAGFDIPGKPTVTPDPAQAEPRPQTRPRPTGPESSSKAATSRPEGNTGGRKDDSKSSPRSR